MNMKFYFLYPFFLIFNATMSYAETDEARSNSINSFPRIVQLGPTSDAYFVVCHAKDCPSMSFKHLKTSVDIDHSNIHNGIHADTYKKVVEQSNVSIEKIESATPILANSDQRIFKKTKAIKKRKRQMPTCLKQPS